MVEGLTLRNREASETVQNFSDLKASDVFFSQDIFWDIEYSLLIND
jgi:hypothetical protein